MADAGTATIRNRRLDLTSTSLISQGIRTNAAVLIPTVTAITPVAATKFRALAVSFIISGSGSVY